MTLHNDDTFVLFCETCVETICDYLSSWSHKTEYRQVLEETLAQLPTLLAAHLLIKDTPYRLLIGDDIVCPSFETLLEHASHKIRVDLKQCSCDYCRKERVLHV